jgi:FAD/FMN-containing dehydrogenase
VFGAGRSFCQDLRYSNEVPLSSEIQADRGSVTVKPWLRRLLIFASLTLLLAVILLARPGLYLSSASRYERDEREPLPAGFVDDASRLNTTGVAKVWQSPSSADDAEAQLAQLLQGAHKDKLKISIGGARHSMGGHTIYPGGVTIDMLPWKRMELDEAREILYVQAGALWRDVIAYLDRHGRSVAIMQSNNAFSVGGSLSVNCHGWQFDRPPIASTVESFRLMLVDGTVKRCSRTENQELFSLVLGGYGLFGIILDAELRVVPNERYRLRQFIVPAAESLATLDAQVAGQNDVQMAFGRMNIVPATLFDEIIINAFHSEAGEIPAMSAPGSAKLRRAVFRGSADDDYGKGLRWRMETELQPMVAGEVFSRNQLLNEGVELFQNRSVATTDILHEYFVPRSRAARFVNAMRKILIETDENLLNVTVRMVNEDTDTFLRYADQQMLAFVMLFVQERSDEGESKMRELSSKLIDCALEHEGRYYLPYRLHASAEQFRQAYPQSEEFFRLKRKYDPTELFQNQFYLEYGIARNVP